MNLFEFCKLTSSFLLTYMKIIKSFALFYCAFFISTLFSQTSGIRFDNSDDILLHHEYTLYENVNGTPKELIFDELSTPYASSNPILITKLSQLKHITTSAGDESPVKVCQGDALTISSTYTSTHVEYVFKRIRSNVESIVQHRSTNLKLELSLSEYLNGDVFFIEIYDLSSTPTQNLQSSKITIEVLTLPSGSGSFDGGTIEQEDQIICNQSIPETLTTSGEPVNLNFTYQWEYSFDSGNTFNEIDGATNPDHIEGFELKGWDANNASQALYFIYSVRGVLFDKTVVEKSGTFILIQ